MKLVDGKKWIWLTIIALMPIVMSAFAALVLTNIDSVSELFYYRNVELFIVWEIAYLSGGLLTYREKNSNVWIKSAFISWGVVGVFLVIGSFIWAGIRISDGFSGLAYFVISCLSWCFSLLPLLLCAYLYKIKIQNQSHK